MTYSDSIFSWVVASSQKCGGGEDAEDKPICDRTEQRRASGLGRDREEIYVTVSRRREGQGRSLRGAGTAKQGDRLADRHPETDRKQVAEAIRRGAPRRSRRSLPSGPPQAFFPPASSSARSEEHTSELQSPLNLVC